MKKYSLADVIVDPKDPRVEVGKTYYYSSVNPLICVDYANEDSHYGELLDIDNAYDEAEPFHFKGEFAFCIIERTEPKREFVPFDFSDASVRSFLLMKSAKCKVDPEDEDYEEGIIQGFRKDPLLNEWLAVINNLTIDADSMLEFWVFTDGSPCGTLEESES